MNCLRSLAMFSVAAAAMLGAPAEASADCSQPSDCLCGQLVTPTYALDVVVPQDADLSGPVELEVLGAYGGGADALLEEDGRVFTLVETVALTGNGIEAGDRALLLIDAEATGVESRRLDEDGELDCYAADAQQVEEVALQALSANCQQEVDVDRAPCDDSGGCSISGAGPSVSLWLLALLGFLRRNHR